MFIVPYEPSLSEQIVKRIELSSRYRELFKIYERENMTCEECGKVLKPFCNTKKRNGKTYCINCYWDLWGREEMQTKFKQTETWDHEMPLL